MQSSKRAARRSKRRIRRSQPIRNPFQAAVRYRSNYGRYKRATGQRVQGLELARFFVPWYRSLLRGRSAIEEQVPWIVFSAFEFLERRLAPGMRVLEFGVGGSTLYFLRRGCLLTSIEHDEKWTQAVSEHLTAPMGESWTPLQIPPEAAPVAGFSSHYPGFESVSFQAYAQAANRFPDGCFDIVFVDGRARDACIRNALPKVRPGGGILMLDNAERPRYEQARGVADSASVRCFVFGGPGPYKATEFWQTVAWEF